MILVTGASGTVGSEVVRQLLNQGHAFRASVRRIDKAAELADRVPTIAADYADVAALVSAMTGADALFMASFDRPDAVGLQANVLAAAKQVGVKRIVRLSAGGAAVDAVTRAQRMHGLADRQLMSSGLPWVLVKPRWFSQNLIRGGAEGLTAGEMRFPIGNGRFAFTDVRDVAAVAIKALVEDTWERAELLVSGPDALSFSEVAAIVTEITGRELRFRDVPVEEYRAAMVDRQVPEFYIDNMLELFARARTRTSVQCDSDTERVLGRAPTTFRQFVSDHRAEWSAILS